MERLKDTIAGLRLGFEEHFRSAGSISLFVGLACNLAFVGQVYFWPAMWHTSAFMFSYTDASYVAEFLCALVLGQRLRRGGCLAVGSRALWILALLVQATLALYCALFGAGIHVPDPVNWICGAVFGIYLPVVMTSWLAVHVDRRPLSVVWNIVLAGVFASFVIWVFSGLEAVKLCVCMGVLMFVGTFVLSRKLRPVRAKEGDASTPPTVSADAFRYPASATFLFSFSFITAIAFAGIGGESASYASGDFFAPMLLLCAVVLLANAAVLPLTTIAVPAIIVAVIAASYLHLEPALSFDLAALGMFLFLAYAVVLLCASAKGNRRRTLAAFTGLMVAFAAGCLIGRLSMALCFALAEPFASNIMVLLSILAANAAMIILIRRGATPGRSAELFEEEQAQTGGPDALRRAKVDRAAAACGLGEREKEVLMLLLEGRSASEVASAMVVANGTAKSHIRHVYKKLGVHSRDELFEKLGIEREGKRG